MIDYAIRKRIRKDNKLIESYRLVSFALFDTYNEAKCGLDMFINLFEHDNYKYNCLLDGYIPKSESIDNYTICYDIFGEIII